MAVIPEHPYPIGTPVRWLPEVEASTGACARTGGPIVYKVLSVSPMKEEEAERVVHGLGRGESWYYTLARVGSSIDDRGAEPGTYDVYIEWYMPPERFTYTVCASCDKKAAPDDYLCRSCRV